MSAKKIGIWGFGCVGKSALAYFAAQGYSCSILDKRELSPDEIMLLKKHNANYIQEKNIHTFFSDNDLIFASPGIDINPYKDQAKFICELDVFSPTWRKPLIAVTGTVGKTSTTTLLGNILQKNMRVAVGGNIGTPMLSFLDTQDAYDYALLELSSWQQEHALPFSPDIALWTNFFPNHLDRHQTMDAYFNAKLQILLHQTAEQTAVLPLSLYNRIAPLNLASRKIWIDDTNGISMPALTNNDQILYIENTTVVIKNAINTIILGDVKTLTHCTYLQNMLFSAAVLHTLNLPFELLTQTTISVEHRLEKIISKNTITFYNDSKSTVPESTLSALAEFKDKQIILFLGGLSKGIDRTDLVRALPKNIREVICFGTEAEQLNALCRQHNITGSAFNTLEPAFAHAIKIAQPETVLLFSPAGSSYDLYTDYAARGKHFKQLVAAYTND